MADFLHGVRVIEIDGGIRPLRSIDTAIIGIVATADDADAEFFPLNTPVLITHLPRAIGKAGTSGTLATALYDIFRQANAMTVVVRVAEHDSSSDDGEAQNAAVIGEFTGGRYTGAKALLTAAAKLNVTPRIIGAPELDSEPVTKELLSIAKKLNAFVYAEAAADSKEEATTYRNKFSDRELMLIFPKLIGWSEVGSKEITRSPVATALGLRAKLDNEIGWHKTLSNVAMNGMTGISHDITFSLTDSATDANYLNKNEVTTVVNENGFRFWGNRTPSDNPLFAFESFTRTAQVLREMVGRSHLWAMDKPLSAGLAGDIIAGIDDKLRQLTTDGYLLGGSAWFDESANSKTTLKDGQLWIDYDFTPVPPLEQLGLKQRITDRYLIDFGRRIEALAS